MSKLLIKSNQATVPLELKSPWIQSCYYGSTSFQLLRKATKLHGKTTLKIHHKTEVPCNFWNLGNNSFSGIVTNYSTLKLGLFKLLQYPRAGFQGCSSTHRPRTPMDPTSQIRQESWAQAFSTRLFTALVHRWAIWGTSWSDDTTRLVSHVSSNKTIQKLALKPARSLETTKLLDLKKYMQVCS